MRIVIGFVWVSIRMDGVIKLKVMVKGMVMVLEVLVRWCMVLLNVGLVEGILEVGRFW